MLLMPFETQVEKLGKGLENKFSKYQSHEKGANDVIENLAIHIEIFFFFNHVSCWF
jgi:hypothetical protein